MIEYLMSSHLYHGYSDLIPVDDKYQSKGEIKISRSETLLRQRRVKQIRSAKVEIAQKKERTVISSRPV